MNGNYRRGGLVEQVMKKIEILRDDIYEMANELWQNEAESIYKELGEYQRSQIEESFNEVVSSFYSSYKPRVYERTGGLYELLSIQEEERGTVKMSAPYYKELYDETQMHPNRKGGNNLYKLVFQEGYHGGAPGISSTKADVWGEHPSPGTPYYRRGGVVKYPSGRKIWHRYGRWGKKASKAKISPYKKMAEEMANAMGKGGLFKTEFNRICQEHLDKVNEEVRKKVPDMVVSLFRS